MAQYKINIINNYRDTKKAEPFLNYVKGIADKYKFDVDFGVKHHGAMSKYIRKHRTIAPDHKADGYFATGGGGHWKPTGATHKVGSYKHPYMKRANRVYNHLVEKENAKIHGICEGFQALVQTKGAYTVNSGKLNANKKEGIRHKYVVPNIYKKNLGKATVSKETHQGVNYITGFEDEYLSGTQHHPETRKRKKDEKTIVGFLEKVTGQKASPKETLDEKVKK